MLLRNLVLINRLLMLFLRLCVKIFIFFECVLGLLVEFNVIFFLFKIIIWVCLNLIKVFIVIKLNNKFIYEICLFCVNIKEMSEYYN